jgi:polysaccharide biosynthesis transport protein
MSMPEEMLVSRERAANPPTPTLRDVLGVIFRQRRVFLYTFALVVLSMLLYGLLAPSYQAHMKVLLRRGRVDPAITAGQNPPLELSRQEISEEELNSEVELLRDESSLRKVVEANGLAKGGWKLPLIGDSDDARAEHAVRKLARRLKVEPLRKTNLIAVSYEAADPAAAARILQSLQDLYLEKHKQVHRPTGQLPFFEQQTERSRQQLEQAESRLLDFSRGQGVVSAALERDLAIQRTSEIETRAQQVRVDAEEVSRRIRSLENTLEGLPPRSTAQIRTGENPQLMETLKGKLLALELQRTELLTKFEPSYRPVQEVDEQIRQAKAAIAAEQAAPPREETTEKDPNYEWAKAELEKAQVDQSAIAARQRVVTSELATARQGAQLLGEDAVHQQDLLRNMKTAEETYLLYAKKSEEARIGDALDERGIVNVAIAEPPVAPALPKHSALVILLAGLAAATATSTGLAFAADYLDPALRTPDEVVAYLHAPVLASLPRGVA